MWLNHPHHGTEYSASDLHRPIRPRSAVLCPNTLVLVSSRLREYIYKYLDLLWLASFRSRVTDDDADCCIYFSPSDLTSRPGFWGKALPERYVDQGVLFSFYFTTGGDVMLNVDGHDKGVFLTGLDSRTPLWVMVDIYGNTTGVQFVGKLLRHYATSLTDSHSLISFSFFGRTRSQSQSQQQSHAEFAFSAQYFQLAHGCRQQQRFHVASAE